MSMKSSTSPRRIYSSKGTVVFCFGGKLFAPAEGTESTFRKNVPVTVESLTEDGGLVVKQRKPHAKVLCETWYPHTAETPTVLERFTRESEKCMHCVKVPS